MTAFGTDSLLNRRKAANAVTSSGPIHPQSRSVGIGVISRSRSTAIRAAAFAAWSAPGRAAPTSAPTPTPTASLTVSAPPGPLSSGSMAGWPAAVAVIARNAMWMEARVGSANGSGRDNDRDTTSRAGRGVLTLAGVPIGRPEDAPPRLAAELATADVVAAEDTRRVRQLAAALNVTIAGRVMSYYDVIETRRAEQLAAELAAGKNVPLG